MLPFAVPAEDRRAPFTSNMEKAAVFSLAEMERKKGGGILKRKESGEELVFNAKFCYPTWLVPWNGRSLLFDGLGKIKHKIDYNVLPDVDAFITDLQVSEKTREAYSAFLSGNLNFFKNFLGGEERVIDGLVTDPELIQEFSVYIKEAKVIGKPLADRALLSPALDYSIISSLVQDLSNLSSTIKEDIKKLRRAMKLLSNTTQKHVKAIRGRIEETQKEFDEKIKDLKSSLSKKATQIRERYDKKITRRTKEIERKLHRLHQKSVKVEKDIQGIKAKIERCNAEIRSSRLKKDEPGEIRWKEELERCKEKLSALEESIKDIDKDIESATAAKKQEIAKLRAERDEEVEAVMKEVKDVEAARDAKIRMSEQEIDSLKDWTTTIVDRIDDLVTKKAAALEELDEMGISKRIRKYALTYVPFYLVCHREGSNNRYILYPPSVAGSMGLLTKFKGVFGVAKAKSLLQPRSNAIATLFDGLLPLIEQNPVFEQEIVDAGIEADILQSEGSRKKIKRGLEQLEEEGWISESELQTFDELLART